MRRKAPSLPDYDPVRVRTVAEEASKAFLFPEGLEAEERLSRVEAVAHDLVQEQIRTAPLIATAHDYATNEANALQSAMATAAQFSAVVKQIAEAQQRIERIQLVRESRSKLMIIALAIPAAVIIAGMIAHVEAATLAAAAGGIGAISIAIVHALANRAGRGETEIGSSIRPPK